MKSVPFILLFMAAAALGIATFVENARGTAFVHTYVYGTWWFALAWTAIFIGLVVTAIRRKMWKRWPSLLLHAGFVVVFAGALLTAFTGHKGILHLRQGIPATSYVDGQQRMAQLPFTMTLERFRVEYYVGTDAPADYVSDISCHTTDGQLLCSPRISMNRIFSTKGYRFYQTSFDEDHEGSWLTVNHDPYGTTVSYAGFTLLCIGFLLALFDPQGGFRRLLRHPLLRRGGLFAWLCLASFHVDASPLPVVKRTQADSLASVQVVYNGRIAPLNTPARDFVQKVYGAPSFRGLTPEQVVASWQLHPEAWNRVPFIRIKSSKLRERLGIKNEYAMLSELFDGTDYKLQALWQQEMGTRGKMAKAIQETDEKVGLALMLTQGTLVRPLPPGVPGLSSAKVRAELWYNRIPFLPLLSVACLVLGTLAFVRLLCAGLRRREAGGRLFCLWGIGLEAGLVAVTLLHALGYGLRWYIGGRVPLGNGYETMLSVALCALLTAALLRRRFPPLVSFGLLLAGFSLLVARLGQMDPYITPLMPVLSSPWLSAHVSLIMMAYALLAFLLLGGVCGLCLPAEARRLMLLGRLLLYPAVFLLGAGIFLGAVWANVSWGRYWAWDPKEVWALITFMAYSVPFHGRSLRWLRRPRAFHLYLVVAFLTVLTTYFGVNYLMGGMHSYA